jgi:aspartate aminotransferase
MFSSPCNPTGAVYTKKELDALAEVFLRHPQIFIMSDEIYEYINYTGAHVSIASHAALRNRVVVINGLSKGFAMTGWRIGYLAGPEQLVKACEKIQGQFTSGTNAVAQRAAIAALTGDLGPTRRMVEEFAGRRKRIMELLNEIPGFVCNEPPGAFYVFPQVSRLFGKITPSGEILGDADSLCMYLLNEAHVTTVTGRAFGEPGCIRISFANSMANIEKGMEKIRKAIALLS